MGLYALQGLWGDAMNPVALVLLIVEGLLGVTVIGGVVWAEFFAGRKHLG